MTGAIASFSIDSREIENQSANNFTFELGQNINLPQDQYEMCLARGLLYYSWYNFIPGALGYDFTFDGVPYPLPEGNYSILTLEAKIKEIIEAGGANPDDFNMSKHYPTGNIRIDLLNVSVFTPESVEFSTMIGFTPLILLNPGINYGTELPDFEGENKRVFITNSLVAGNYNYINDSTSRYIYEVRAPLLPAFSQFNVVDTTEDFIWFDINTNKIQDMTIQVVNQDGILVDLHKTHVKFWFLIRPKPNNIMRVYDRVTNPVTSVP